MELLRKASRNRFLLFIVFSAAFVTINLLSTDSILPTTETKDIWFYSGIFMVLFSTLFIEPYYSSPKNVITNAVPLLLVFLAIEPGFNSKTEWWFIIGGLILLIGLSIFAISIADEKKGPEHIKNIASEKIKNFVVLIGRGKRLYSAVFLYFLFTYYVNEGILGSYVFWLLILWAAVLLIDHKDLNNAFTLTKKENDDQALGQIFGVESEKMFLIKLFDDVREVSKFDLVQFKHSMSDKAINGIVFDQYLLNQERWAKILALDSLDLKDTKLIKDVVYKINESDSKSSEQLNVGRFTGVVVENSKIGKIRFEYSKKEDDLREGDLLELEVGEKILYYQVVGGKTEKLRLQERNEAGFIVGEAIQLGEWDNKNLSFNKFGWVPHINTPLFTADTSVIEVPEYDYPEYKLGVIPGTNLPSLINLDDAISHHMAILGVTGSGKSFIAREIIKKIEADTKVICIDFNKEFIKELDPPPTKIISDEKAQSIASNIDWINNELDEYPNNRRKSEIATRKKEIVENIKSEIDAFLDADGYHPAVFELPDVVNTKGILDYTKYFFRVLFEVAKQRQQADSPVKICVVLEEAHTIVPEWNFLGSSDKTSQSLINSIGQIALQGRKYGIGFMVIAQRTANVSKTVLTQCNTVVCFQAFDETSFNFLGNYVGSEMVTALPTLQKYHAVVTGKAVKSNTPMIIDLKRTDV